VTGGEVLGPSQKSAFAFACKGPSDILGNFSALVEFTYKVRKERRRTWDVLRTFLRKYCRVNEDTRVLLLLLPRSLVDKLLSQEFPDRFVEEAIRECLAVKK
jgi:hypothetical protein